MGSIKGEKTKTWVGFLIGLGLVGGLAWFFADWIFPVYRWLHLDFDQISARTGIPANQLDDKRTVYFRFDKRGTGEPYPYQLIMGDNDKPPAWVKDPEGNPVDEYRTLVRVHLMGDRSGGHPKWMMPGKTYQDAYYKAEAWRLPPNAFGDSSIKRTILFVDESTIAKLGVSKSNELYWDIKKSHGSPDLEWLSDDDWPERSDGWKPPRIRYDEEGNPIMEPAEGDAAPPSPPAE